MSFHGAPLGLSPVSLLSHQVFINVESHYLNIFFSLRSPSSFSLPYYNRCSKPFTKLWRFSGPVPAHPCLSCTVAPRAPDGCPQGSVKTDKIIFSLVLLSTGQMSIPCVLNSSAPSDKRQIVGFFG